MLIIHNPFRKGRSAKEELPQKHFFVKPFVEEQWMRHHVMFLSSEELTATIHVTSQLHTFLDIYVRYNERPTLEEFAYKTTLPDYSSCRITEMDLFRCALNPYSFDITSNLTGHIGRHFIGIIYSEENEAQRVRKRKSLCGEDSSGRQRRSCVGVKDPPTPLPQENIISPEYNASSDVNYTMSVSMGACLYWHEVEQVWTTKGCKVRLQNDNDN